VKSNSARQNTTSCKENLKNKKSKLETAHDRFAYLFTTNKVLARTCIHDNRLFTK